MKISMGHADGALVITILEPRLDAAVAINFKDLIRDAVQTDGAPVILDMSKVEFMDSSGLGAIVGVMKLLGQERPLELAGLTQSVRKVFRLTRMDTVFKLHDRAPAYQAISAAE